MEELFEVDEAETQTATHRLNDLNVEVSMHDTKTSLIVRFNRFLDPSNREDRRAQQELQVNLHGIWVEAQSGFVAQLTPEITKWLADKYPNAIYDESSQLLCHASRLLLDRAEERCKAIQSFLAANEIITKLKETRNEFIMKTEILAKEPGNTALALQIEKIKAEVDAVILGPEEEFQAHIKAMGMASIPKCDYPSKREPRVHQRLATWCMVRSPLLGLQHDMGTGKTQSMIDALCEMARRHNNGGKPMRVLIVVPRAILVNWIRELAMCATVDYKIAVGTWLSSRYREELRELNTIAFGAGDYGATEALLELVKFKETKMQIMILNYDTLKGRCDLLKKVNFDVAILDEAHKIKNPDSKRSKLVVELAETCKRRYFLTGTPITQGPQDLYSQYEFLGPQLGLLGHTTFHAYQKAYCKFGGRNGAQITGTQNMGLLLDRAARWSFTLKKEQCVDLPPKVYEERLVEMSEQQRDIYNQVSEEVLIALESLGAEVTVQNILVQYLRLCQVACGYVKTIDGREVSIPKSQVKVDALIELLAEEGWPKVVVWTRFIHELKDIEEKLGALGIKYVSYHGDVKDHQRQLAIDSFQNDPETKVFIGTATSGGVGITLTAASMVVYVSNDFSLGNRLQSEDRVHRIGQTKSVTYVDILCEDSIDELIFARLTKKREVANFFNDPSELASSLKTFLIERRSGKK